MAIKEPPVPTLDSVSASLRSAGFEISAPEPNTLRVQKRPCATVLEQTDSGLRFAEPPGYLVGGMIARLEDRGFQKYLTTSKLRIPALAEHLKAVHQFSEQLKAALGVHPLYNESLGTVSNLYLYDRLAGRE